MGIRPQKVPTSNSQIVRDLLEQIERIYRDVRKTAMQAYIKYKAYCDKKVNASTLKKKLCFCLTAENISPRKQNSFTDFRCIGLHIIEKVLPKKNCLTRKIGTNKMQVLRRMRMSQVTTRQPIPDIQITPREWKPDPEVIIINDLYARSWEREYEKSIFNSDCNNPVTPNSPEDTVRYEVAADETSTTPGTIREISPENFPGQTDRVTKRIRITTYSLIRIRA